MVYFCGICLEQKDIPTLVRATCHQSCRDSHKICIECVVASHQNGQGMSRCPFCRTPFEEEEEEEPDYYVVRYKFEENDNEMTRNFDTLAEAEEWMESRDYWWLFEIGHGYY